MNNMFSTRQTRSLKRNRRKSPRNPSSKRAKNSDSFICTGCNGVFDSNRNLLRHKKASDNPKCSSDLVKCEFCSTPALNEYGLTVHQRTDIDCMHIQNAIDNTNVILSDGEDGPLSKHQHQFDHNDQPFEDPGLFEIYGGDVTGDSNSKKRSGNNDNTKKSSVSSSNTEELFVLDQDTISHGCKSTSRQPNRHLDPIIFDLPTESNGSEVVSKKQRRRINKVSRGLSKSLPNEFITAQLFYTECVRNNVKIKISVDEIEAQRDISSLESVICKVFRLTNFGMSSNAGDIDTIIKEFYNFTCDCPEATSFDHSINDQHLYAFIEKHGVVVRDPPPETEFNSTVEEQDDEDERDAANALDTDEYDSQSDSELESDDNDIPEVGNNAVNIIASSVDRRLISWQRQLKNVRENTVFDKSDIANIELFEILRTSGAPKYLFESIQKWSGRHSYALTSCNPVKRSTFVRQIRNKVYGNQFSKEIEPKVQEVYLKHGARIPIVYFSFRASLASLLSNVELMNEANLLLNPNDPFNSTPDGFVLSDLNSGWWYRETCKMFHLEPQKDILLPIILFIDGSTIDTYGKLNVEPITFTLGIFKRSVRNRSEAWRTLGYIESLKHIVSEPITRIAGNSKRKLQDKHTIMKFLMKELIEIQGPNSGFEWDLSIGGKVYNVTFKIAVQVVIGDCKGNDELCARYGSHNKKTAGFCRDCKVTYNESDNPDHLCQWISPSDFLHLSEEQTNKIGFHLIDNAFSKLNFGAGKRGIYGATPSEPLHSFKLGICKYLFDGFYSDHLPKTTLKKMDKALSSLGSGRQRQSYQPFPKICVVRNGLTGVGTLTADEQFARVFCVFLCLQDPLILKSLSNDKRYVRPKDDKNDMNLAPVQIESMGLEEAKKWFVLFQDTVLYHSWLYSECHDVNELLPEFNDDNESSDDSETMSCSDEPRHINRSDMKMDGKDSDSLMRIRRYLRDLKNVLKRSHGNEHKLVKLHQQLHNPRQILKDGSLLNVDGGRCESIAIHSSKKQAGISQKRSLKLNWQIANNLLEDTSMKDASILCNGLVCNSYNTDSATTVCDEAQLSGSQFVIFIDNPETITEDNTPVIIKMKWKGRNKTKVNEKISKALIRRLYFNLSVGGCLRHDSEINGFTEVKMDGHTYRAHPSYWGEQPWYDWALVQWDHESDPYPAQICMFLDLSNARFMNDDELDTFKNSPLGQRLMHVHDYPNIRQGNNYEYLSRTMWMLVRSSLSKHEEGTRVMDEYRLESSICNRYYMEDEYRLLPLNAIAGPAFCLHVNGTIDCRNEVSGSDQIICLKPKEEWKSIFINDLR